MPGGASLPEVHSSVETETPSLVKRMFAFAGPAYLISVGYMDPGNWATDLEAGARFGYQLLWVLVMSNAMAIILQTLSARLGIVTRRDLAQACREAYPAAVSWPLWVLCEIAIAACDLAEVLGAAIGFNLLFGIPLLAGVLLTAADTLLVLWFTRLGIRVIESVVLALVTVITGCFLVELAIARPPFAGIVSGLAPHLPGDSLYVAIGILGATVMPHNLYLHSALVQTRRVGESVAARRAACRYNLIDSVIALNGAMIVNAAILILAAAVFFARGIVVTEIKEAQLLLAPLLGYKAAGVLFAVALLCSGQSSTLTGTLAGQIVMEGFINLRMTPSLRRFVTRVLAVAPAALTIWYAGDKAAFKLLILSQVILSMQLPFAVIPLIQFTGDRKRMGEFTSSRVWQAIAWLIAFIIVALNVRLVWTQVAEWMLTAGAYRGWVLAAVLPLSFLLAGLLVWISIAPFLPARWRTGAGPVPAPGVPLDWRPPVYRRILVTLDHSALDRDTITHAAALAKAHGSELFLLHVEEDVPSQVYGKPAATEEVEQGRVYFEAIREALERDGILAHTVIRSGGSPRQLIVQWGRENRPDLVVMGAHGHTGLKDLIFGSTIDAVRHDLGVPILVVRHAATG